MIDKFNFYDVYGYFVPGASLLLLLWLPFGVARNSWPAADWGSTVIAIVVAYVTGHFLQMICTKVIPSTVDVGVDSHPRYPSDVVLDKNNSSLSDDFKKKLAKRIRDKFDLDTGIEITEVLKPLDEVRRDAFFLARHVLIHSKEVNYSEQFEGLYTLTRNLAGALAVACASYTGWAASILHRTWLDCVVVVVVTVSLLAAANFSAQLLRKDLGQPEQILLERLSALAILLTTLGAGYGTGERYDVASIRAGEFALCAVGALALSLRSYSAYKSFANNFAVTIWRDFFAATNEPEPTTEELDV